MENEKVSVSDQKQLVEEPGKLKFAKLDVNRWYRYDLCKLGMLCGWISLMSSTSVLVSGISWLTVFINLETGFNGDRWGYSTKEIYENAIDNYSAMTAAGIISMLTSGMFIIGIIKRHYLLMLPYRFIFEVSYWFGIAVLILTLNEKMVVGFVVLIFWIALYGYALFGIRLLCNQIRQNHVPLNPSKVAGTVEVV